MQLSTGAGTSANDQMCFKRTHCSNLLMTKSVRWSQSGNRVIVAIVYLFIYLFVCFQFFFFLFCCVVLLCFAFVLFCFFIVIYFIISLTKKPFGPGLKSRKVNF
jgi:hypothetical protein